MLTPLLISADDRTGALEIGGACAGLGFSVRVASTPSATDDCLVIDLASRHVAAGEARRRIRRAHASQAAQCGHKMDSGLRGNWAHEAAALVAAGRRVGILASYPDAGRRCHRGTVYVHDVPVAEGPHGRDPRNPLASSRPVDFLVAAGCARALEQGDIVVLDANDNAQLDAAARRCRDEGRMPVGATGAIAAWAALFRNLPPSPLPALPRPALIACGSLHPLSRTQIARLPCARLGLEEADAAGQELLQGRDAALVTPMPDRPVDDARADAMARRMADAVRGLLSRTGAPTLIVLGGDTAEAILGTRDLHVRGDLDTGVPLCVTGGLHLVTKGGSIGDEDTLRRILA